jgi:hypothetical protein
MGNMHYFWQIFKKHLLPELRGCYCLYSQMAETANLLGN